jgi:metal transporter CNNM
MSLDTFGLEIAMASDNPASVKAAKKIQPLRRHGNWLLCTLLLGNVAVNAALSILLAEKSNGLMGFITSTALIVMFGEIIPQAICCRYALEIGSRTTWIVWPIMILLAFIAWPISYVLDLALGEELGVIYSKKELQRLVDFAQEYRPYSMDDGTASMLKGALGLNHKSVSDIYTDMKSVFWLDEKQVLSYDVLTKIFKLGHSRIPVFRTNVNVFDINAPHMHCVGLLYVKDLILVDPNDSVPITKLLNTSGHNGHMQHHQKPIDVWKTDDLQKTLQLFISTCQHLAFVKERVIDEETSYAGEDEAIQYIGIVTLEDVIEEILKCDVVDEYDNYYVDLEKKAGRKRFSLSWENSLWSRYRHKNSLRLQTLKQKISDVGVQEQENEFVPVPVPVRLVNLRRNKVSFSQSVSNYYSINPSTKKNTVDDVL